MVATGLTVRSIEVCIEKRLELRFGNCPYLLGCYGAVAEQKQGWNSANVLLRRRFRILIVVDLDDSESIPIFGCDRIQDRRDHLARAAPFRPKVEKHGLRGFDDVGLEGCVGRMYDLITHVINL